MGKLMNPNIKRICINCGSEYHPASSRQKCCNLPKTVICPICGKEFETICKPGKEHKTCSKGCADKLIQLNRSESASKLKKTCKACGKEFTPKTVRDEYCDGPHYKPCTICGKLFEYNPKRSDETKTCSDTCRYKLALDNRDIEAESMHQKQTLMDRYGVDNAAKIPGNREKTILTNREKFGADWYTQTDEYVERVKNTSREKYDADHHLSSQIVKDRRIKTVNEKFDVDNVFQLEFVKDKSRKTNLEKYGVEYITQLEAIQDTIIKTNLEKYGETHPMKLDKYKNKAKQTNRERYNRDAYTQQHIEDIESWYEFIRDPEQYILAHYQTAPRTCDIAKDLGVDISTVDDYMKKHNAYHCVRKAKSLMETEILDFIKSIRPELKVISNDKSAIAPMELDIYVPELNFAIECNPTCTHNSSFIDPWGGEPKSRSYHKKKTDACEVNGIFLFHIFGYEWTHKKDVILSMIRNILHANDTKIYARNCEIRPVGSKDCRKFLNVNHRQGYANASVRLGLYYDNELISVMTFGHIRATIGSNKTDKSNCWELVRFCSKINTTVIGGADRLFKHFIKTYDPIEIISFSDHAHTKGSMYNTLGFSKIHTSGPSYMWVNVHTDIGYHRYNAQKRIIKRFLKDPDIDLSKTEKAIMEEHGFAQVFDCGTVLWIWQP
jgi:hypothetical protein